MASNDVCVFSKSCMLFAILIISFLWEYQYAIDLKATFSKTKSICYFYNYTKTHNQTMDQLK